jgi:hypothetical protein
MTRRMCMVGRRAEAAVWIAQCLFFTTLMHVPCRKCLFHPYPGTNEAMPTFLDRANLPRSPTSWRASPTDASEGNLQLTGQKLDAHAQVTTGCMHVERPGCGMMNLASALTTGYAAIERCIRMGTQGFGPFVCFSEIGDLLLIPLHII